MSCWVRPTGVCHGYVGWAGVVGSSAGLNDRGQTVSDTPQECSQVSEGWYGSGTG
jgi:hypothetical protein